MRAIASLLVLLSLAGCGEKSAPDAAATAAAPEPSSDGERCSELMKPMIAALWESSPEAFEEKFGTTVVLVKQSWDLGGGATPYVLGPPQTTEITDRGEFASLVETLTARAGERDDESIPNVRAAAGTDWDATFVKEAGVSDAQRCALTVDIGDVEHVLLAAFAGETDELKALYYN